MVGGLDKIWAADLADLSKSSDNGYKYILCVIDVFSKYGWLFSIKNKTGIEIIKCFKEIFQSGRQPEKIWSDQGKEFFNKQFIDFLKDNKIELYHTYSELKSSIAEIFVKNIKSRIWKQFTISNSTKWVEFLPEIISNYNSEPHNTLKQLTPSEASEKVKESLIKSIYYQKYMDKKSKIKKLPRFKVGDRVRLYKYKKEFEKGFDTNFTKEIFVIKEIKKTIPVTYIIEDLTGEKIEGSVYEYEMIPTKL